MLEIEILPDGGAIISGTEQELLRLAHWLRVGAQKNVARAAFVTDEALTAIEIRRQ